MLLSLLTIAGLGLIFVTSAYFIRSANAMRAGRLTPRSQSLLAPANLYQIDFKPAAQS